MFHRIGRFVVRHRWWTIVAWLVAAAAIVATAPKLTTNTDESSFLPRHYESIKAAEVQSKAFPQAFTPSAIFLFERTDGGALDAADKEIAQKVVAGVGAAKIDTVEAVIPSPETSKDGKYTLAYVKMKQTGGDPSKMADAAEQLRDKGKELARGSHLDVLLGGSAAQQLDQQDASQKGDSLIAFGTIGAIVITLLIIFRAPIIALLPILLVIVVAMAANGLIADANKLFDLKADSTVTGILVVVLFGVGTDYFLFLMFRYRERLRAGDDPKEAVVNAVGRVGEAIASAAGAVIIAFMALILSSLGMFRSLGPSLAIAVAVTLLAALTLFPAVLSLFSPRVLFWPSKAWQREPTGARFASFGRFTGLRPALVAGISGLLMAGLALAALGFSGTFDLASGSMPKDKESMVVQSKMISAYSAGAAEPTHVYLVKAGGQLDRDALPAFQQKLQSVPGVASAEVDPQSGISKDGTTADFTVLLKDAPASGAAIDTVDRLRNTAHADAPAGTTALVGGITAVYKDINLAMDHDYKLVFPVAALLIMVILGLLLRSVVAPWYLMASVGLGFGATLGATTLLFQNIQGESGLMFMLPIIVYLFVVAIGTDYNILMIARLREEAREGRSPREAASMAIRHTGPTVAAAGFILAASFATLMLAGNSFMTQMGFAVAFGIVVAAFVMSLFFTPALTALIGHAAWWPGHADSRPDRPGKVVASGVPGQAAEAGQDEYDASGSRR
ncbi:MMPL family transporter [Peterkaempfera bronchialis]|uniref:MMPL family transporter n=1 Tax=Peterkaempfera bronchialis TaxID=2126346 RepID=A0A345STF6_9ACTN|nr:MMPL family transporter [Peterkaempfera bronchialis]AXI77011.1 MMPL family transporter [Peterkaempfera bronchialis]